MSGAMFGGLSEELTRELVEYALRPSPGTPRRWHITRLFMYRRLENLLKDEDSPERTALSISHSANLAPLLGLGSVAVEEANFPEHDITDLAAFADESFDFVLADQVLEHVAGDPFAAFRECHRVLKPGGIVVQTTCFFNLIHQHPTDFWRFTPNALRLLCENTGLEVTSVGGWGNREAWHFMWLGYRMHKIPEDPKNPIFRLAMKQDKKYPVVTWVLARRP